MSGTTTRAEGTQSTDPSTSPDSNSGTGRASNATYPGTPRWVKVSGIVVVVLVLLVVGVVVAAGGQHGLIRHTPSGAPGELGGETLPAAQTAQQA